MWQKDFTHRRRQPARMLNDDVEQRVVQPLKIVRLSVVAGPSEMQLPPHPARLAATLL
jgi:hypothetical protein